MDEIPREHWQQNSSIHTLVTLYILYSINVYTWRWMKIACILVITPRSLWNEMELIFLFWMLWNNSERFPNYWSYVNNSCFKFHKWENKTKCIVIWLNFWASVRNEIPSISRFLKNICLTLNPRNVKNMLEIETMLGPPFVEILQTIHSALLLI